MRVLLVVTLLAVTSALRQAQKNKFDTDYVTITEDDDYYYMESDGMPEHEFDDTTNPGSATAQDYSWTVPKNPTEREGGHSCVPGGAIGYSLTGVALYPPYTSGGEDAVLTETFDDCEGHNGPSGAYHYHQRSSCFLNNENATPKNRLMGVAIDGIPIYGPWDADSVEHTQAGGTLDECNGHWTYIGGVYEYVYRLTSDFPYTMDCLTFSVPNRNLKDGTGPCNQNKNVHVPQHKKSQAVKTLLDLLVELFNETN